MENLRGELFDLRPSLQGLLRFFLSSGIGSCRSEVGGIRRRDLPLFDGTFEPMVVGFEASKNRLGVFGAEFNERALGQRGDLHGARDLPPRGGFALKGKDNFRGEVFGSDSPLGLGRSEEFLGGRRQDLEVVFDGIVEDQGESALGFLRGDFAIHLQFGFLDRLDDSQWVWVLDGFGQFLDGLGKRGRGQDGQGQQASQ